MCSTTSRCHRILFSSSGDNNIVPRSHHMGQCLFLCSFPKPQTQRVWGQFSGFLTHSLALTPWLSQEMAPGASPHPGPCLLPGLGAPSQIPTRREEVVSTKAHALFSRSLRLRTSFLVSGVGWSSMLRRILWLLRGLFASWPPVLSSLWTLLVSICSEYEGGVTPGRSRLWLGLLLPSGRSLGLRFALFVFPDEKQWRGTDSN